MIAALLATIAQLLHVALVLAVAPLLDGVAGVVRAALLGQAPPSPLQPWRKLIRLARKQPVLGEGASPFAVLGPPFAFAASLAAAALVPSFALGMATAPVADLLVLIGLLALARVALTLAALDAGTAPAGLAAGPALGLVVLAAPALLLVAFVFALAAGGTNIDRIATLAAGGITGPHAALALALAALVLLAATPPGGPARHDEFSGRYLALAEGAAALRQLTLLSLGVALFVPYGIVPAGGLPLFWPLAALAWAAKLAVLTAALAAARTLGAAPTLAGLARRHAVALALALLAALLLCVEQGVA